MDDIGANIVNKKIQFDIFTTINFLIEFKQLVNTKQGCLMESLFNSSGYISPSLIKGHDGTDIDFSNIPSFLRVLLTTDGTVTKSLESFFWEEINVHAISQRFTILKNDIPELNKCKNDTILERTVQLRGSFSNKIYASANSMIAIELLPQNIQTDIKEGRIGIGELLRECYLETFREIISFGRSDLQIWRNYLIKINKNPTVLITEIFPISIYL